MSTTIGIIGAGHIGSQLAKAAVTNGYQVVIANSRGPETLASLVEELGQNARAATVAEASVAGDLTVVTIPLAAVADIDPAPFVGRVVISTNNYYPQRDGQIEVLDDESTTVAEFVQAHFAGAHVVNAFNHILAAQITSDAAPRGTAGRRALAVYADDASAKAMVSDFIDAIGFDPYDGGTLADSWRIQRDTPAYGQRLTTETLPGALDAAKRYRDM